MQVNHRFLESLYEQNISYFSYSMLKKGTPIISYCNDEEWLRFYNEEYSVYKEPPVQKYITSSALKLLMWDACDLNQETNKYLRVRNEVVGAANNATLIHKHKEYLTVVTLGTKHHQSVLTDYFNNNSEPVSKLIKALVY